MLERVPAQTIGELDIHLGNLQQLVSKLSDTMATRSDVDRIERRLTEFATKSELSALEAKMSQSTIGYMFSAAVRFAAGAVAIIGFGSFVVFAVVWFNSR